MPTSDENKCYRQMLHATLQPSLHSLMLDQDALSVVIIGHMDVLVDRSYFTNKGYQFSAYWQYVLWQNGYSGRGNRKIVPPCATCSIKDKSPSPNGVYTGYKCF